MALALSVDLDNLYTQASGATLTTAAFTTNFPNELLVAFVGCKNGSIGNPSSLVTTGLTWNPVNRKADNSNAASVEIFYAFAPNILTAATIAATASASGPNCVYVHLVSFNIVPFHDITGANAVGANTTTSSIGSSAATATILTTRDNSWVWGIVHSGSATTPVAGSNQTLDQSYTSIASHAWATIMQNATTPKNGTSVTINATMGTINYQEAVIEIYVETTSDKPENLYRYGIVGDGMARSEAWT